MPPRRLHLYIAPFALWVLLLVGGSARAADPQIDPGSPAGTEYQLPVDRARDEASGGSQRPSGTSGGAVLFGAGVEKREATTGNAKSGISGSESGAETVAKAEAENDKSRGIVSTQAPEPDSGAGPVLAIGGGAAVVLLVGAAGGLALRRRTAGN